MKPRIFINMHYMELGGAERALLGLLYALDTDKVDVDLFINQHTGPFMKLIPDNINLLPEIPIYSSIERPMKDILLEGHFLMVALRLWNKLNYRFFKWKNHLKSDATGMQFLMDAAIHAVPKLHHLGEYDLAISFIDPPHIVQDKVLAKKKIEWIHTDFSSRQRHYDVPKTIGRWSANDYIVSISDAVTDSFLIPFPQLKDKIIKIENIIPVELVLKQSEMDDAPEFSCNDGCLKICSVGRIAEVKNFHNIPHVVSLLKEKGISVLWLIVGPGDVDRHNQICKDCKVEKNVRFIGPRTNPYPYMRECDIYVQPSLREGKSITVQEAQMLGKPVIVTRYSTSSSQIADGKDGIICDMDNSSIANAIYELANDKEQMKKLGAGASKMHKGNNKEAQKLLDLIDL